MKTGWKVAFTSMPWLGGMTGIMPLARLEAVLARYEPRRKTLLKNQQGLLRVWDWQCEHPPQTQIQAPTEGSAATSQGDVIWSSWSTTRKRITAADGDTLGKITIQLCLQIQFFCFVLFYVPLLFVLIKSRGSVNVNKEQNEWNISTQHKLLRQVCK